MCGMQKVDIRESPEPQLLSGKGEPVRWGGGVILLPHLQRHKNISSGMFKELLKISKLQMPNKRFTISNRSQQITILGGVKMHRQSSTREDGSW